MALLTGLATESARQIAAGLVQRCVRGMCAVCHERRRASTACNPRCGELRWSGSALLLPAIPNSPGRGPSFRASSLNRWCGFPKPENSCKSLPIWKMGAKTAAR